MPHILVVARARRIADIILQLTHILVRYEPNGKNRISESIINDRIPITEKELHSETQGYTRLPTVDQQRDPFFELLCRRRDCSRSVNLQEWSTAIES